MGIRFLSRLAPCQLGLGGARWKAICALSSTDLRFCQSGGFFLLGLRPGSVLLHCRVYLGCLDAYPLCTVYRDLEGAFVGARGIGYWRGEAQKAAWPLRSLSDKTATPFAQAVFAHAVKYYHSKPE